MQATNILNARIVQSDSAGISAAASLLSQGQIVAVPTETVYGLAADASNAAAVAAIYAAKGRPDFNPLIVHVADVARAELLAIFSELAHNLANAFWPGPLTLVLPQRQDNGVTGAVTAGLQTIALRCPAHPAMRALLAESGMALAAPSANKSGTISPTKVEHVAEGLGKDISLILDGGVCTAGLESTIIAIRENGWQLLRPGPITAEQVAAIAGVGPLPVASDLIEAPGQLASHYAPRKLLRLEAVAAESDEWLIGFGQVLGDDNLSELGSLAEAAAKLFDALHRADNSDSPKIAVASIPDEGIGVAINDRLARAAVR